MKHEERDILEFIQRALIESAFLGAKFIKAEKEEDTIKIMNKINEKTRLVYNYLQDDLKGDED